MPLTDFVGEFSKFDKDKVDDDFIFSFPYECIIGKSLPDVSVLLYVSGYVATKLIDSYICNACSVLFGDKNHPLNIDIDDELYNYFNICNRGGLIYPSNNLFLILQYSFIIFNICIDTLENTFILLRNQKDTLLVVIENILRV